MRKLVSLLGILAVVSMYATSAIAGPVPPVYMAGTGCSVAAGNCGESDLVPSGTAVPNQTLQVDWMVLDISGGAGAGTTPNLLSYRANWEALVGNGAYVNADISPGGPLFVVPSPAVLPATVFAYLYQPENCCEPDMRTFSVDFNIPFSSLLAAGVLYNNALSPFPNNQSVPLALAVATLNATDGFGNKVDDLDRNSNYHPGHIVNSCTGGAAMCFDTPAVFGVPEDGVPSSGLEEEGLLPTDVACPGGSFTDPGEFCEAAGLRGYTTAVTTDVAQGTALGVIWDLHSKPIRHETPTLYILTTLPPVPGAGSLQGLGAHQWTTEQGSITGPGGTSLDVFGTRLPVPAAIPEPGTFLLMGTGLACLVGQVLRRKSKV